MFLIYYLQLFMLGASSIPSYLSQSRSSTLTCTSLQHQSIAANQQSKDRMQLSNITGVNQHYVNVQQQQQQQHQQQHQLKKNLAVASLDHSTPTIGLGNM